MNKCKHGLKVGTCWTCKTGERIKPSGESKKGDGLFHEIEIHRCGHDNWNWPGSQTKRIEKDMGLKPNKTLEAEGNGPWFPIPKTPCDIG